jgi:hypothetical protein
MQLRGVLWFAGLWAVTGALGCTKDRAEQGASGRGGAGGDGGGGGVSVGGAAGGSPEDLPFAVSGQRLTAWFLEVEGNPNESAVFSSFHDALLDTDCDFVPSVAGGRFSCLPSASADIVYLDGGCTKPAMRMDASTTEAPGWVSAPSAATRPSCAGLPAPPRIAYRRQARLFAGGLGALGQTPPGVFTRSAAGCEETSLQSTLLPPDLYALDVVGESAFVVAKASVRRLTSEFSLQRLEAEDGAELTLAVLGVDGVRCEPQLDGLCVPFPFSVLAAENGPGIYLDAVCSERAFVSSEGVQCGSPKLGLTRTAEGSRVSRLGVTATFMKSEQIDPTTGIRILDAEGHVRYACEQSSAVAAFAPNADVTATLPRADQLEARVGELRWVQQRAPIASGAFIPFEAGGAFVDDRGIGCRPRDALDQYSACVTDEPGVHELALWSDPACEHRLYGLASSVIDISRVRQFVTVDTQSAQLLSFKRYSGSAFELGDGRCRPASTAGWSLEVDHVFALPRLTRVAR